MRIMLHGGPRDGWVYEVDEAPEVVRVSRFDGDDPRTSIEQAHDIDNLAGVYLPRQDSMDYDWHSEREVAR